MGFQHWMVLLLLVESVQGIARASTEATEVLEVTVLVHNHAKASESVVTAGEVEAARIFRDAGIHVRWVDCSKRSVCHHEPGANEYELSIVPDGQTSSDLVYGVAFLGPAGEGKYYDVFLRRIEAGAEISGENTARLLGAVMAHELGHLMLGSHAHTYQGIMSGIWTEFALKRMDMGNLLFSKEQAALMRAKVEGEGIAKPLPAFTLSRARTDP